MANNLSTAQRTAFSQSYFQDGDFVFSISLINGSKNIDILSYLIDVQPIDDRLYNYNDKTPGSLLYPSIVISLFNDDGTFSVGHEKSTWVNDSNEDKTDGWILRTQLQETLSTGTAVDLMPESDWYVSDVEYTQGKATITATHPLLFHWHKIWNVDDSHDLDWNGLDHYGPDWKYKESG